MNMLNLKRIAHKVDRVRKIVNSIKEKHEGKTQNYTYHGGWELGYHEGKLAVLEDILDDMEIEYQRSLEETEYSNKIRDALLVKG